MYTNDCYFDEYQNRGNCCYIDPRDYSGGKDKMKDKGKCECMSEAFVKQLTSIFQNMCNEYDEICVEITLDNGHVIKGNFLEICGNVMILEMDCKKKFVYIPSIESIDLQMCMNRIDVCEDLNDVCDMQSTLLNKLPAKTCKVDISTKTNDYICVNIIRHEIGILAIKQPKCKTMTLIDPMKITTFSF